MSENTFTSIQITKADLKRFRGYAKHPKAPNYEVMKWILDQLETDVNTQEG